MNKPFSGKGAANLNLTPNQRIPITGRWWLLFLLVISVTFSGCKEEFPLPAICPVDGTCSTYVTVEAAMCGNGIWGPYWFRLDDGSYLQPWSANIPLPENVAIGERYLIGYSLATRDSSHPEPVCLALPPPATSIRITCLEQISHPICNTFVTVEANSCFAGHWGEFWLKTDQGSYLMPWEGISPTQTLVDGQRLKIGFEQAATSQPFLDKCTYVQAPPVSKNIRVTCMEALPSTRLCNNMATAEYVICGVGVWQNLWLRLSDGTYLQPWETAVTGVQLEAGKQYKFGYDLMGRDNRYNHVIICAALPPAADAARIVCIEEVIAK